ncbi:hypothetical protein [Mucilaginibacter arboris]|uniref:Uncharacterized protein n=1 Tax=Mucilaginibacter arboris TaxID=2682090 RepID=A0A7K1SY71_9SPHI|nr:hypothetical protein [Mucilaginibacter arboris]MVN22208.1 hypothetical protein [Mucilaginibacter arboris]
MNQTFNINRFSMLFKKHTLENYKTYLMSVGVLAGLLVLFMGIASYANDGYLLLGFQEAFFVIFLLLAGCIFTSLVFADLGDKKKAIPALTLPASHFEKYLVSWLYSFLIFQLLYVALFYLIAALIISFGHDVPGRENVLLDLFDKDRMAYMAFVLYPFIHSVILFGAIYFEKLHFIKTGFAFFTGIFLLGLLNRPIISSMIDETIRGTTIFSPLDITDGKNYWTIFPPEIQKQTIGIVLGIIVVILWVSAYFRLKEKEV